MLIKNKIPFVNENELMKKALKILNDKKLGFLVVVNNQGLNAGVFTDGDLKRIMQKKRKIGNLQIKSFMTKKPYTVEKNTLVTEVLSLMNKKKLQMYAYTKKTIKKKQSELCTFIIF